MANGNRYDAELDGVFEQRERDWRNGAVVYQVLVDRFAPSADLAAKRHLYPPPKVLRPWSEPAFSACAARVSCSRKTGPMSKATSRRQPSTPSRSQPRTTESAAP